RAVVDARETVTRLALRIDARVATDEGASVLVHDRHAHGDPNSDVPTREARGDQHDLRVVARRDEQIPAGDDRDPVGPRSEAAALRARVDPVAVARVGVRLHDRHADRACHADLATAAPATTAMTESFAVAVMLTSFAALIQAPSST